MYRVELKASMVFFAVSPSLVPNVPCGVERNWAEDKCWAVGEVFLMYRVELKVRLFCLCRFSHATFLMYRVELKVGHGLMCGHTSSQFLMYRVELKGGYYHVKEVSSSVFLMYRVELKEL